MAQYVKKDSGIAGSNKMKNRRIIGVIFLALFFNVTCLASDWRYATESDSYVYFYDASNLKLVSKNIKRVWIKRYALPKGVESSVSQFGVRGKDLSHLISLDEMNCIDRKWRTLQRTAYDKDGNTLRGWDINNVSEWDYIVPDSVGEGLFMAICKNKKSKHQNKFGNSSRLPAPPPPEYDEIAPPPPAPR